MGWGLKVKCATVNWLLSSVCKSLHHDCLTRHVICYCPVSFCYSSYKCNIHIVFQFTISLLGKEVWQLCCCLCVFFKFLYVENSKLIIPPTFPFDLRFDWFWLFLTLWLLLHVGAFLVTYHTIFLTVGTMGHSCVIFDCNLQWFFSSVLTFVKAIFAAAILRQCFNDLNIHNFTHASKRCRWFLTNVCEL